jgi:hypothetical protein
MLIYVFTFLTMITYQFIHPSEPEYYKPKPSQLLAPETQPSKGLEIEQQITEQLKAGQKKKVQFAEQATVRQYTSEEGSRFTESKTELKQTLMNVGANPFVEMISEPVDEISDRIEMKDFSELASITIKAANEENPAQLKSALTALAKFLNLKNIRKLIDQTIDKFKSYIKQRPREWIDFETITPEEEVALVARLKFEQEKARIEQEGKLSERNKEYLDSLKFEADQAQKKIDAVRRQREVEQKAREKQQMQEKAKTSQTAAQERKATVRRTVVERGR